MDIPQRQSLLRRAGVTKTHFFLGGGNDVVEFRVEGGDALSQVTINRGGSDRLTVIASADTRANVRAFLREGDDFLDLGGQFPNPSNTNRATIDGEAGNDSVPDGNERSIFGKRRLSGGPGNDTLHGGPEVDAITGGDGADSFLFIERFEGEILDFQDGIGTLTA